jgi:hypothetical protein
MQIESVLHYFCVAMALGAVGFVMLGFFRRLSLSENEHRLDRACGDIL